MPTLESNYFSRKSAHFCIWSFCPQGIIGTDEVEFFGEPSSMRRALARVSVKDAVGEVAEATGLPRREIYQRALALAKEAGGKTDHGAAD